ncbi:MAG: ribonuclease J [Acidobacteriota bacterium]
MTAPLEIVSLGGTGGFGMNATLYLAGDEGLLVDFGTGFPHGVPAGIARMVPDVRAVAERWPRLRGIALTHGHDDHVGALGYLPVPWRDAPVHGTPLTLAIASDRIEDAGAATPPMRVLEPGDTASIGPFRVRAIHVTHSVPSTTMLAIDTPAGTVLHTGDFRFDGDPVVGPRTDWPALAALARDGVRLVLCDSTGALRPGHTTTEASVARALDDVIASADGQVFVSTFASQLHRLASVIGIAARRRRTVGFLSRRMERLWQQARDLGLVASPAGVVARAETVAGLPPERCLWLAGGCQGEPDSSMVRLSWDSDRRVSIAPRDLVVFTASVIPGNETDYARLVDRLLRLGARVEDSISRPELHSSGHGARDEIARLLATVRPAALMPVHGDRRHLEACAELAAGLEHPPGQIEIVELGGRVAVDARSITRLEPVEVPPMALDDAGRLLPYDVVRQRRRLSEAGFVVVLLARDGAGPPRLADVRGVALAGDDERATRREVARVVEQELARRAPAGEPLHERIERRVAARLKASHRARPAVVVLEAGS